MVVCGGCKYVLAWQLRIVSGSSWLNLVLGLEEANRTEVGLCWASKVRSNALSLNSGDTFWRVNAAEFSLAEIGLVVAMRRAESVACDEGPMICNYSWP